MTGQRGALDEAGLLLDKAYVGGTWTGSDAAPISVDDPFTLERVGTIPDLSRAQVASAIDAAQEAFPAWGRRPVKERCAILRRWCELILRHREDLARLITRENGKTLKEARAEVDYGNGFMEFYADYAAHDLGELISSPVPDRRLLVEKEPVGVCVAITPWNFPLAMLTRKVAPALAAGCTMVAKPAELTPLTALAFAKLGEEAGVPAGVFSVVTGHSRSIGEVMTSSMVVRKLSFTGSTPVGAFLAEACAPTIKRLSLELGGNAPLLVFDDADLDTAVETAMVAKFRNGGQSCIAANRIYVQRGIEQRFLAALATRISP
ncbi:MAG TPA: aldehyde dehydrogenase family protein, partial [Sphingomonadaceae bacterium]|nr:aldehyde dehydrogenase family protein [Sphingomonadaceae bacterium]